MRPVAEVLAERPELAVPCMKCGVPRLQRCRSGQSHAARVTSSRAVVLRIRTASGGIPVMETRLEDWILEETFDHGALDGEGKRVVARGTGRLAADAALEAYLGRPPTTRFRGPGTIGGELGAAYSCVGLELERRPG